MFPARPTPRSSRRAVAAARSDPPHTVAETHVPCPRFQARGFKPEAQPTRLALRSGHTPPVPGPHSEVTAPPYTPQPRDRASCRRPNLAPEHHPEYAADPTVHCLTPTSPGTGTVLRSRNHARAAAIAHRIATAPNPLRQQHAGIATSHRTLRNPHQATHRNRPAPHRSVSPLRTATRHACFRASSDNQRHPDFPLLSGKPYHIGSRIGPIVPISCSIQATPHHAAPRIGTDTTISESLRITAITPALGSEQSLRFSRLAERKPANRRHPIGIGHRPAEAPEDTRPGLPHRGTPGRRFPRHPATPRIRPPRSPPRRQPPEDDLPKTTPKMPSRATKSGAAPQLTKKNGRSYMPANRRSAENRSPASLRDVPRPPRKTAELGKYAKCVRFVSDFGNFL